MSRVLGGSLAAHGLLRPRIVGPNYASEVLADEPFAYWRFEETSGSIVEDVAGANEGTVYGANLDLAGQIGSGVSFDGVDDYIDLGTLGNFGSQVSAGSTWEFLYRAESVPAETESAFGLFNDGDATAIRLQGPESGSGFAFFLRGESDTRATFITTANVHDGAWHHIAYVIKSPTTADCYVDGSAVSVSVDTNGTGQAATANFQYGLLLGANNGRGTPNTFGALDLDEFALYDKELDPARILVHAQMAGVA